jgi:hypothetical protein
MSTTTATTVHYGGPGQSQTNPFAEPELVYSNVRGSLGVLGAYALTTTSVRIK